MKASEYKRGVKNDETFDELRDYIETDDGKAVLNEFDSHWSEVMELAERYGFICQAAGGVTVLATHEAYEEANGTDELAKRLRMCNVEIGGE